MPYGLAVLRATRRTGNNSYQRVAYKYNLGTGIIPNPMLTTTYTIEHKGLCPRSERWIGGRGQCPVKHKVLTQQSRSVLGVRGGMWTSRSIEWGWGVWSNLRLHKKSDLHLSTGFGYWKKGEVHYMTNLTSESYTILLIIVYIDI